MTTPNEREAREPMFGAMLEADFEKNTVTFEMRGDYYAAAGLYEIRPHDAALTREQPQQEAPGAVAWMRYPVRDGVLHHVPEFASDGAWVARLDQRGAGWIPLYAATPPAPVDVRKLRELATEWKDQASHVSDSYTHYENGRIAEKKRCAAQLIAIIDGQFPPIPPAPVDVRVVKDPTGFSAAMVLDEANNWTARSTGKQMLLNYAALLSGQQAGVDRG